ncbi:MAG TPA: DUF4157 domain-containing protein [Streptosporangiaceae bacterium]
MSQGRLAARVEPEAGPGPAGRASAAGPAGRDLAAAARRAATSGLAGYGTASGSGQAGRGVPGGPGGRGGPAGLAGTGHPLAAGLLRLQRAHGNRYVQRLLGASPPQVLGQPGQRPQRAPAPGPALAAQPALRLGRPGDRYEREADRLAEDLASGHASPVPVPGRERRPASAARSTRISRTATTATAPIARSRAAPADGTGGTAGGGVGPAAQQLILGARGQGRPLPATVRRRFERGLGTGLAAVRVHTDPSADGLNRQLGSSAFTTGQDIFFRRGEYDPASDAGREVLAHELVHVVQQTGGSGAASASPLVQRARTKDTSKKKKKKTRTYYSESESESEHDSEGDDPSYVPGQNLKRERDDSPEPHTKRRRTSSRGDVLRTGVAAKQVGRSRAKSQPLVMSQQTGAASEAETTAEQPAQGTAVPTGYRSPKEMAEYLAGQGLTTNREPEQVSVGVVVWNINHLKAGDDDDDVDEDVAAGDDEAMLTEEEAQALIKEMAVLQEVLGDVADPVAEAIENVIAELDREPGQHSETRREISQLGRDIYELRKLDLASVLMPAVEAMTERVKDGGKSSIEARASQLERIRALARVWKRLKRLLTVLVRGGTSIDEKATARETVRGQVSEGQADLIGEAIDELLRVLSVANLEAAVGAVKRGAVIDLATRKFFQNSAVNLVLINEMNLGITNLESAAERSGGRVGVSTGPIMLAKGQLQGEQLVGRQYEYYPAVHRASGNQALTPIGTFYVSTDGRFAVQQGATNSAIGWDKAANTFRGIVVHRYKQGTQEFWAGVLHTTPAGKDLNRTDIWPQIQAPLHNLNKLAQYFKIPLLVGGDFYIPAEGIVNAPTDPQMEEIKAGNKGLLGYVKASNFARNVYLEAARAERTPELLKNVREKYPKPKARGVQRHRGRIFGPLAWETYCEIITPGINELAKQDNLVKADALELFAPGMGDMDVSWSSTQAAGDIREADIVRNYERSAKSTFKGKEPLLTMQRALEPLGYRIVDAGSPTNPKEHGRGDNKMQLADLFVVNDYWKTTRSGIVTPETARLKPVDDSELRATRTYWKISDHSPVAMLGSTTAFDLDPYRAFDMGPSAEKEAVEANETEWNDIRKKLGPLQATGPTVEAQIDAIKKILQRPLAGPSWIVLDLRDRVTALRRSILGVRQAGSAEQQEALKRLGRWRHPFYTSDFGEEVPKGTGQGKQSAQESAPAIAITLGGDTDMFQDEDIAELGAQTMEVDAPEVNWPTGQTVNVSNSCYLAALIHVFASHDVFRNLLDPKHKPGTKPGLAFQTHSGLATLVARLRDPKDTITADDMEKFMGNLDGLGGVLTARRRTAANEPAATTSATQPANPLATQHGTPVTPKKSLPKPTTPVTPKNPLPKPVTPVTPSKSLKPTTPVKKMTASQPGKTPAEQPPGKHVPKPEKKSGGKPAPPPLTAKEAKTTAKGDLAKQAAAEAVKATAAGNAFGLQQDASEVLIRVLALLRPSNDMLSLIETTFTPVNAGKPPPGGKPVAGGKLAFGGLPDPPNITEDPVVMLRIESTVHTMAGALREFSAAATVQRGTPETPHHKRMQFVALPRVLTLILKRFDAYGKIMTPVLANDPLEIPEECLTPALKTSLKGNRPTYRLQHVVRHSGDSMRRGHYTSYGKLPGTETWYRHDDAAPTGYRRAVLSDTARDWALNTGYIYVYVRE